MIAGYQQLTVGFGPMDIEKNQINGLRTYRPDLKGFMFGNPETERRIQHWIEGVQSGRTSRALLLTGKPGLGKCHGIDTPILMYDGSSKKVQDIQVGDRLMGPDSSPRTVLSLARGQDQMYRIHPIKGDSWVCNEPHVLSLTHSNSGERWNIPLNEYLKNPDPKLKLWRASVEWKEQPLSYDPYIAGVWLGDGTRKAPQITNSDIEITNYLKTWSEHEGLKIREVQGNNTITYCFSSDRILENNPLRQIMQDCLEGNEKHIPSHLKVNSKEIRLQVLAGLLDTDGCLTADKCGYEITFKDKRLAEDTAFIARSLGFAAYVKEKQGTIKDRGFVGTYWRINISGDGSVIPCKVQRKKAQPRRQIKNVLRTGFKVEPLGSGDYYGFEIDGDHLYLLGDFTVTHNTTLALAACKHLGAKSADIKEVNCANTRTLEDARELLTQIDYAPSYGTFRVLILDEVHQMVPNAQKAFLTPIENLPSETILVACTSDPGQLDRAFRSRFFEVGLEEYPENVLIDILQNLPTPPPKESLATIIQASGGNVRKAISLAEGGVGPQDQHLVQASQAVQLFFLNYMKGDLKNLFNTVRLVQEPDRLAFIQKTTELLEAAWMTTIGIKVSLVGNDQKLLTDALGAAKTSKEWIHYGYQGLLSVQDKPLPHLRAWVMSLQNGK